MHKTLTTPMFRAAMAALAFTLHASASAQLAASACGTQAANQEVVFPTADANKSAKLTARIIDAANGTFCYEVYSNDKLLVKQTNVPGRVGNNGCPTRDQAEKLSTLVIEKIQRGEMPPTVTNDELKALEL